MQAEVSPGGGGARGRDRKILRYTHAKPNRNEGTSRNLSIGTRIGFKGPPIGPGRTKPRSRDVRCSKPIHWYQDRFRGAAQRSRPYQTPLARRPIRSRSPNDCHIIFPFSSPPPQPRLLSPCPLRSRRRSILFPFPTDNISTVRFHDSSFFHTTSISLFSFL